MRGPGAADAWAPAIAGAETVAVTARAVAASVVVAETTDRRATRREMPVVFIW